MSVIHVRCRYLPWLLGQGGGGEGGASQLGQGGGGKAVWQEGDTIALNVRGDGTGGGRLWPSAWGRGGETGGGLAVAVGGGGRGCQAVAVRGVGNGGSQAEAVWERGRG